MKVLYEVQCCLICPHGHMKKDWQTVDRSVTHNSYDKALAYKLALERLLEHASDDDSNSASPPFEVISFQRQIEILVAMTFYAEGKFVLKFRIVKQTITEEVCNEEV